MAATGDDTVLITNISVIDATGTPAKPGMNVLIEDGYITAMAREPISAAADTNIDGSGKFLIPGLWDMHVHWYDDHYLPLFIANGVTGVRQMWGVPRHYDWKAKIDDETFVSPRSLIASVIIDGPNKTWPGSISVESPEEGKHHVRQFYEMGADFIKVYSGLQRDAYFAIAEQSRELGIPFAGHVPILITAEEASDAGQKSFEHLTGISIAASPDREAIVEMFASMSSPEDYMAIQARLVETFDPSFAASLFEKLRKNNTWQSPTLTVLRNIAYIRERAELDKERLAYLPAAITSSWDPANSARFQNTTEESWQLAQRQFEQSKQLVGEMNRAGVRIIAGTDVFNPYCFPGFSLHDELELLVESGLTSMQALQAATRNAAEFSDRLDILGTVEVGKVADLVILNASPLENIANTTTIDTVIFDGRVHDRKGLDAMLKNARERASK